MVTNFVNMNTDSNSAPGKATITWEVQALLRLVISELGSDVSSSKNETYSFLCWVNWGKFTVMRVNLKMERATIFDIASWFFTTIRYFRCFNKLPLGTLVVRDKGLNVLLNFEGGNRFLNMENLVFGLLLLPVHSRTHATGLSMSWFFSNHVCFIPVLLKFVNKGI